MREALLNLRAEGLLVQHPRRCFMVVEFTARDLADVAQVQAYVGGELAARAAENISAEQLSELKAIQDKLEKAYQESRFGPDGAAQPRVPPADQRRGRLAQAHTSSCPGSPATNRSRCSRRGGWPSQSIKDHRRVIDALERRDPERPGRRWPSIHHRVTPLTEHLIARGGHHRTR